MSDRIFNAVKAALAQSKAAEDVQFEIHGFPALEGSSYGREAVLHAILSNFDKVTQQIPKIEGLIEQGNSVAMLLHETGIFKCAASCGTPSTDYC